MMLKSQEYQVKANSNTTSSLTTSLIFGFLSYIIANITIAGGISPLNVAILACTNFVSGIAIFGTSLLSYFFNGIAVDRNNFV